MHLVKIKKVLKKKIFKSVIILLSNSNFIFRSEPSDQNPESFYIRAKLI